MDSIDDFELKPLSKGLGFHKKTTSLSDNIQASGAYKGHLKKSVPKRPSHSFFESEMSKDKETTYEDLLASLSEPRKSPAFDDLFSKDKSIVSDSLMSSSILAESSSPSLELSKTLPRKNSDLGFSSEISEDLLGVGLDRPEPSIDKAFGEPIFPEITPDTNTPKKKSPFKDQVDRENISISSDIFKPILKDEGTRRGGHNTPPTSNWVKAPICLRSIFLDTMVSTALALIFLLSLLLVTEVDLMNVWSSSQQDLMTQVSMGLLYISVYQIYVIISRSFFGKTLGEWTFDFQMGSLEQQKSAFYPIRVLLRSLIIVLTGVVVLPLFSFIFRRDIAAYFSGLQLYEQK